MHGRTVTLQNVSMLELHGDDSGGEKENVQI